MHASLALILLAVIAAVNLQPIAAHAQSTGTAIPLDLSSVANTDAWPKETNDRIYIKSPDWSPPQDIISIPLDLPSKTASGSVFYKPDKEEVGRIPVSVADPLYGVVIVHASSTSVDAGQIGWRYRFSFDDGSNYELAVRQSFEVATRWKESRSTKAYELWRGDNGATEVSAQALPVAFPEARRLVGIEILSEGTTGAVPIVLAVTGLTRYQDVEHLIEVIADKHLAESGPTQEVHALKSIEHLIARWDQPLTKVSPMIYGTNIAGSFSDPNHPTRTAYMRSRHSIFDLPSYMAYMKDSKYPLIRIHSSDVANRITDAESRSLAFAKFAPEMNRLFGWAAPQQPPAVVFTFPKTPKWLAGEENTMPADEFNAIYARLCAEAAQAALDGVNVPVRYWEPFNEQERRYPDNREVLWDRWVAVAQAIRKVDPEAQMVGPSLCWPDSSILRDFVSYVDAIDPELLDVVSWHRYGFGRTPPADDADILQGTERFGQDVSRVRELVKQLRPHRETPLFLGEFNISYAWNPSDPRQQTHVGAAWYASVLQHMIRAGLEMSTNWHLDMTGFGMLDVEAGQLVKYPSALLYPSLIEHLQGQSFEVEGTSNRIEAIAAKNSSDRALLLVHKDHGNRTIQIDLGSIFNESEQATHIVCMTIDNHGANTRNLPILTAEHGRATVSVDVDGITTALLWTTE